MLTICLVELSAQALLLCKDRACVTEAVAAVRFKTSDTGQKVDGSGTVSDSAIVHVVTGLE